MGTGLIKRSASESLSTVSDSSLPVLETTQDINRYITQNAIFRTNKTCIEPFPFWSYVWRTIRELSGDDAYERYIAQHATHYHDTPPLARKDFFLYQQQQKWSGIQRCC
ncbi:CstA-like transporter-associated (seleno)protein [Candidatus Nitrotoga sp. AM1P]|uniref:CstA-like transporter-associated (seleno)protein n=1 Tax=Candidatus Nitrotoga sp. AM1P TaxID=2559597 RepID=UPI001563419E|nr:YbdD/YjiX family protein [Candidatus Nitrotoga sp. AM1P]